MPSKNRWQLDTLSKPDIPQFGHDSLELLHLGILAPNFREKQHIPKSPSLGIPNFCCTWNLTSATTSPKFFWQLAKQNNKRFPRNEALKAELNSFRAQELKWMTQLTLSLPSKLKTSSLESFLAKEMSSSKHWFAELLLLVYGLSPRSKPERKRIGFPFPPLFQGLLLLAFRGV